MSSPNRPHDAVNQFAALVEPAKEDHLIDLPAAALAIARVEYPNLDAGYYSARLDYLAQRVRTRLRSNPTVREMIALLNRVLFDEEGFRGNHDDYYDPRNSFLNEVLDRKLGIPITLSIVYMDVARKAGFSLAGVGLPGHFLVKHYDLRSGETFVDPFHRGKILGAPECRQRLQEIYGADAEMQPEFLRPITHREILIRMLNNLRQIYFTQRDFRKGLAVLDLLLAVPPRAPELLRERALVRLNLDQYLGAAQDLANYLKVAPEAADSQDVSETLDMVRQLLSRLN